MKKNNLIFGAIVVIVILLIIIIPYLGPKEDNGEITPEIISCIGANSKVYVSKTCGVCAQQKEILKDYISSFNIIDCAEDRQKCIDNNIQRVPTWIIDGEKYLGKHSLTELKQLTGC